MTVTQTRQGLLITWMTLSDLALLAHALPIGEELRLVLTALLEGRRVAVTADAFEYKRYRSTAPAAIYRRFTAMERQVRDMGLVRAGKGDVP